MARIEIEENLADRANKLGIALTAFCNRKVREECERMEIPRPRSAEEYLGTPSLSVSSTTSA